MGVSVPVRRGKERRQAHCRGAGLDCPAGGWRQGTPAGYRSGCLAPDSWSWLAPRRRSPR